MDTKLTYPAKALCLVLSLLIGMTQLAAGDCACDRDQKVKLKLHGIARMAGTATVNIKVGGVVVNTYTFTAGSIAGPDANGEYSAEDFECIQWPDATSDVVIEPKLDEPVEIAWSFVYFNDDPRYTEFEQGVIFGNDGVAGNPTVFWSKPSSPCLKYFVSADGSEWFDEKSAFVTGQTSIWIKVSGCNANGSAGDSVGPTAGGKMTTEGNPSFKDSRDILDLMYLCPEQGGGALASSTTSTATTATSSGDGKAAGQRAALKLARPTFSAGSTKIIEESSRFSSDRTTSQLSTAGTTESLTESIPYSLTDPIGRLRWEMSLGMDNATLPLGRLIYETDRIDAAAYTLSKLNVSDGNSATLIIRDLNGDLRQVEFTGYVADITTISAGIQIALYPDSQVSGFDEQLGVFTFTGDPSLTWKVENPGGTGQVRFTKTVGATSEVHLASWSGTPQAAGTMTITRFNAKWKEVRAYAMAAGNTQRIETISLYKQDVLQAKTKEIYQQFNNWGVVGEVHEALVQRIEDPDAKALATTYEYWDTTSLPGNLLFRVTHPDGCIEWMPTRIGTGGATPPVFSDGELLRLVQSYEDQSPAGGVGRMAYTEYIVQSPTVLLERVTTTINNTQVGYRETYHDFTDSSFWVKRTYNYADGSGQFAYSEEWLDFATHKPLILLGADGKVRTYVYEPGFWDPATATFNTFGGPGTIRATLTTITHGVMGAQNGIPNQTLIDREVTDRFEHVLLEESYVNTGQGVVAGNLIDRKVHRYSDGRLTSTTQNGRIAYAAGYYPNGDKEWEEDASGQHIEFLYDELHRLSQQTIRGRGGDADLVITCDYDVRGNKVSELRAAGGLSTSRSWSFNLAGELTSMTGTDGLATTYSTSYTGGFKTVTETLPTQATKITVYFKDRALRRITGTAVEDVYFDQSLVQWTDTTYREAVTAYRDSGLTDFKMMRAVNWLGNEVVFRTKKFKNAGNRDRYTYYDFTPNNITRQLVTRVAETGRVVQLFTYDSLGRLIAQGLDFNGNDQLDPAATDRITTVSENYSNSAGAWESVATVQRYLEDNSNVQTLVQRVRVKVPAALAGDQIALQTIEQPSGATVVTTVTLDRATGMETSIVIDNELGRTSTRVSRDGLPRSESHSGITGARTFTYTALGEPETIGDPLAGTQTYAYEVSTRRLASTTDALNRATNYSYYPAGVNGGLLKGTQDAAQNWTYSDYYPTGQLRRQWGVNVYPVENSFDEAGKMTSMMTFRTKPGVVNWASATWPNPPAGDVTQWVYDPTSELLERKVYADNSAIIYTYDSGNFLDTKKNARGQTIDYTFNTAGQLNAITYSDGTPPVSMAYDRAGRRTSVTDGSGTRSVTWTARDQLEDETYTAGPLAGLAVDRGYDTSDRLETMQLKRDGTAALRQRIAYDAISWVDYIADESPDGSTQLHKFDYTYKSGTPFVQSVEFVRAGTPIMTQTYNRDGLGRLAGASASLAGEAPLRSVSYQFDLLDRRFEAECNDGTRWTYGYNGRGEVTSGKKQFTASGAFLGGNQFEYGYDDIGNRTMERFGGDTTGGNLRTSTYADAGALNQLTTKSPAGSVFITGEAPLTLALQGFADGQPFSVIRQEGESFFGEALVTNTGWSAYPKIKVIGKSGTAIQDIESGSKFIDCNPTTFTYDIDGNLTGDSRWNYIWNAENQLIQVETRPEAYAAGAPKQKLVFAYDNSGRRHKKLVYAWNAATLAYDLQRTVYFVYDGWNLLGEFDGSLQPLRVYEWGLDLSGSQDGAGGVGGLLLMNEMTTNRAYYYTFDGNGNVERLIAAQDGQIAAEYGYGPFGEQVWINGVLAETNPFHLSSKYTDRETSLVYYGYRYYNTAVGRWLNRDPLEEGEGGNLFAFLANGPTLTIDLNGLSQWHHRLPQMFEDTFVKMGIDIHDPRLGIALDDYVHGRLHDKTGFSDGLDQYTNEWKKFLARLDKRKGLTKCQKQAEVMKFLRDIEGDRRFLDLLKTGARLPSGMSYAAYSALTEKEKDVFYRELWSAKKAGKELRYIGRDSEKLLVFEAKRLARVGKVVPGLHYVVVGGMVFMTFADAQASGMNTAQAVIYTGADAVSPVGAVVPPSVFTGIEKQYNMVAGNQIMTITVHPDGTFGSKEGSSKGAPWITPDELKEMMKCDDNR
jgi:RHS repeat-associated protein